MEVGECEGERGFGMTLAYIRLNQVQLLLLVLIIDRDCSGNLDVGDVLYGTFIIEVVNVLHALFILPVVLRHSGLILSIFAPIPSLFI